MGRQKVAFGSSRSRTLFTEESLHTRFGLQFCNFVHNHKGMMKEKSTSQQVNEDNTLSEAQKKSYSKLSYCVRTAKRFPSQPQQADVPSAADYQWSTDTSFRSRSVSPLHKPFNSSDRRFRSPAIPMVPGPGCYYKHEEEKPNPKDSYAIFPVYIKCCVINTDKCTVCKSTPSGDYFKKKGATLCRECFSKEDCPSGFRKVRDCSFMHDHHGAETIKQLLREKSMLGTKKQVTYENLNL